MTNSEARKRIQAATRQPQPLTDHERAILLAPCECGHTINDHGTLTPCWGCDEENRQCATDFEALLVERVEHIVAGRSGGVA